MSKIITTDFVKRLFVHCFSNLLSIRGLPDNISFARIFIIGISKLDDKDHKNKSLKENFIKNLKRHDIKIETVNKALASYKTELFKSHSLSREIRDLNEKSKGQGASKEIINELKNQILEFNSNMPLINDILLNAFFCSFVGTDLENVEIPKEPIYHPELYEYEDIQKREKEEI